MAGHVKTSTLNGYLFGFIASVLLTLTAYFLVDKQLLIDRELIIAIVVLAVAQAIIQLIFFLYLGKEARPRSNLLVFLFMLLILSILFIGTLWIMYSLNDRVMPMKGM